MSSRAAKPRRGLATGGLVIPLLLLGPLTGCTGTTTTPSSRPTENSSPSESAPAIGVGQATMQSTSGIASGEIYFYAENQGVYLDASGVKVSKAGRFQLNLSPYGDAQPCLADRNSQILGLVPGASLKRVPIGSFQTDPSYFQTVALTRNSDGTSRCKNEVVATASIQWRMPNTHPSLQIVDKGPSAGATGEVQDSGGVPAAYIVASGDTLFDIASRLGITVDDLAYLNPVLQTPIVAGQTLNLSKSDRHAP